MDLLDIKTTILNEIRSIQEQITRMSPNDELKALKKDREGMDLKESAQ